MLIVEYIRKIGENIVLLFIIRRLIILIVRGNVIVKILGGKNICKMFFLFINGYYKEKR